MARTRPGLTRDAILAAALAIIDDSGLEACTMRAVAADLGVEAMSLYWHVPGKDALMDGVVDAILHQVQVEQGPVADWQSAFRSFGHAFRDVLRRHPNAAPLIASRPVGAYAAAGHAAERAMRLLGEAGFDRISAVRAIRTMGRFVVGSALIELGSAQPPPPVQELPGVTDIIQAVSSDEPGGLFLFGLDAMIDGLEVRLRRGRYGPQAPRA